MRKTLVGLALAALVATTTGFSQSADGTSDLGDAYYHFARAQSFEANGNWREALDEYEAVLALDPTNSLVYSEIAASYLRRQQISQAVDYAERAVRADEDNLDAHQLLSSIYTSQLQNAAADQAVDQNILNRTIEELEHVIRLDSSEREAYLMLGRLYRFADEPERAAQVYRDFLEVSPGSEDFAVPLAELQIEAGNTDEAIEILEEFTEDQPGHQRALILLGEAYIQTSDFAAAADAFSEAVALAPDDVDLLRELARTLFSADRFDEAGARYEQIVGLEPEDPIAWLRLGQIDRQHMNFAAAREHLENAARLVPDSTEIAFNLALLDRDEGRFEDALDRFREVLEDSERLNGRYTRGERGNRRLFRTHVALLHTYLQQYDEAVAAFREIKDEAQDRDGTIDSYIVDTYRTAAQNELALELCNQALEEFPENRQLRLLQADLIGDQGDVEKGIGLLRAMAEEDEDNFDVYSAIVGIYEGAKDFESAQEVLDDMLEGFEEERGQTYFLQGALYERQDQNEEAEKAFRSALEINADNPATLNYLGFMLADDNQKLDEALVMIQGAVDADSINGAYLDSLGWVYYRLEELDLAERYLERAILFSPTDPTLHEHLGDLYLRTGRIAEARDAYERSLELTEEDEERNQVQRKLDEF